MLDRWFDRSWNDLPAFDRVFERMLGSFPCERGIAVPRMNVRDLEDSIEVRLEASGYTAEELDVRVEGDRLTITGRKEAPAPSDGLRMLRRERTFGTFKREVRLGAPVDSDAVEAQYRLGVLNVKLPKAAEARPRVIEVQAN